MALKIKKERAKRLYVESPEWFKAELIEEFGEECFKKINFEDILTFDDACRACGTTEAEFNAKFEKLGLAQDTLFYEKLKIIAKAINQGWVPDMGNTNQYKYYPWFAVLPSGSGFSNSAYFFTSAVTSVGSRLCYETAEKAKYAGTQFIEIYKKYLL